MSDLLQRGARPGGDAHGIAQPFKLGAALEFLLRSEGLAPRAAGQPSWRDNHSQWKLESDFNILEVLFGVARNLRAQREVEANASPK
jgi:hypothetical protein